MGPYKARVNRDRRTESDEKVFTVYYALQHMIGLTLRTVFRDVFPVDELTELSPVPYGYVVAKAKGLLRLHESKVDRPGIKNGRTSHTCMSTFALKWRQVLIKSRATCMMTSTLCPGSAVILLTSRHW